MQKVHSWLRAIVLVAAVMMVAGRASAQLIESWEGGANGWQTTNENATYAYAPEAVQGVTNQSFSANLTGTAGPG
jgi:phage gp37-like protein